MITSIIKLMNIGDLNLAIKMIQEEYRLSDEQAAKISRRLLADEKEFERVWKSYKKHIDEGTAEGVDDFKEILSELLN